MPNYAINYSLVLGSYIKIKASSKKDAVEQFQRLTDQYLIKNYDDLLEVDILKVDRINKEVGDQNEL